MNILTAVCRECRNYFVKEIYHGNFDISDGKITLYPAPLVGQYIRISGSVLNDGVYEVTDGLITLDGARDESFSGSVAFLAIPSDFIALAGEIEAFQMAQNVGACAVTSESFGGYSYTKATAANGAAVSWREVFASRLNAYRRHPRIEEEQT
jgi:hypothetical protein